MATVATVMRTIAGTAYGELLTLPTRSPRRSLRSSVAGAPYDAHSLVGSRCPPGRLVGRSAPQSLALPTMLTPSSAHACPPGRLVGRSAARTYAQAMPNTAG